MKFYGWIIQLIIKWFSNLSAADFAKILAWARKINEEPLEGDDDQRDALRSKIIEAWPHLKTWMVNLLVELAVMWLHKTE